MKKNIFSLSIIGALSLGACASPATRHANGAAEQAAAPVNRALASSKREEDLARPRNLFKFLTKQKWAKIAQGKGSSTVSTPRFICGSEPAMGSLRCFLINDRDLPIRFSGEERAAEEFYDSLRILGRFITDGEAGGLRPGENDWMKIERLSCTENSTSTAPQYSCGMELAFPLSGANPERKEFCEEKQPEDPDCAY